MVNSKYRKRLTVLVVLILLLLGAVLGVTIAYYQDHTGVIKNTFAPGVLFTKVTEDFILKEDNAVPTVKGDDAFSQSKYKLDPTTAVNSNTYEVLAGVPIPKRPYVQVKNLLLDAYLFVEVTKGDFKPTATGNANEVWSSTSGVSWAMADGWYPLPAEMQKDTTKRVYYYKLNGSELLKAGSFKSATQINIMKQDHAGTGYAVKVATTYDAQTRADINIVFKAYMLQAGNYATAKAAWDAYKSGKN